MDEKSKSLLKIHGAVLLFGMSGLFAKLIELPALMITLGRLFFSSIFLLSLNHYLVSSFRLESRRDYGVMAFLGALLAAHWYSFFLSIQLSTVAIGLLSFSSFTIFVTFLEPLIFRERLRIVDVLTGSIAFFGIALIVPEFDFQNEATQGLLWGLFSGFTYGMLSILNRKAVEKYSGGIVAFYQQLFGTLILLPTLLFVKVSPTHTDWALLVLLGILFTGVGHTLFIGGLRYIKAQTAAVITCAEPVYAIFLAIFLLGEVPEWQVCLGGAVILGTVVISSWRAK